MITNYNCRFYELIEAIIECPGAIFIYEFHYSNENDSIRVHKQKQSTKIPLNIQISNAEILITKLNYKQFSL